MKTAHFKAQTKSGKPPFTLDLNFWQGGKTIFMRLRNIDSIAVSVFVNIDWVGQIQYQKPRSK